MTEARASLVAGVHITKAVSLLRPLSSGGMGAVWLADHHGLKTQVVVKFMLVGLDSSDSARTRFSREAAAAAQVKSPHVVQMLDHGVSDDGVPFIVMEHLEGHDLGDEIKQHGALDPAKVVAVITQIAKALSKVHTAGLLHRDIKPDNIFLCAGEEEVFAKLLDFGIAKSSAVDNGDGSLDGETKTGQIVGTHFYMSPEQVTAQKVIDLRSDLWALGVVAYEALTGQRPYDGPSFGALAVKIATGSPPKLTDVNASLPPSVDAWFAKACARAPAERFASAKEMSEAFRAAFAGVMTLPTSDSGQRDLSSSSGSRRVDSGSGSGSGVGSGSGPRAVSPTFGLANTALDDSDAAKQQVALGRSEGVAVVEDGRPRQRSSPLVILGAVVLTALVVGVLLTALRTPSGGASTALASAAPSAPVVASAQPVATASASSTPVSGGGGGGGAGGGGGGGGGGGVVADAVADAGPTTATTMPGLPRGPTTRPTQASSVPVGPKPTAETSSPKPVPSAKPTSEPDPLY